MSQQDITSAELKSRIFSDKTHAVKQSIEANQNLRVRNPKRIFQHDALNEEIPGNSIHSKNKFMFIQQEKENQQTKFNSWVTVIGLIPGRNDELIEYFSRFGSIEQFEEGPGNWCYILYQSQDIAKIAVSQALNGPLIISPNYIVSVAEGRLRARYTDTTPLPSRIDYKPKSTDNYSREKSLLSSVIDTVFQKPVFNC